MGMEMQERAKITKDKILKTAIKIFSELGTPERIRTDQGGEYLNKSVKELTTRMGITHFIAYPPNKANYAERAIKTIKKLLYKQMQSKLKQKRNAIIAANGTPEALHCRNRNVSPRLSV